MATAVQVPAHWNLPAQAHALIGRDQDVEDACAVLLRPDCSLLTLVGPGGIGKTRLALGVAEALGRRFDDGACFVDLTQIEDGAALPSLLATQLGFRSPDLSTLESVTDYLRSLQLLLVLDNFEHVQPAASVVAALLERLPDLKVLATSREPLLLRWEQRMTISPLEIPNLHQMPGPEELRTIPSVALFLQRARAVNVRFSVTDEPLRQIADLCTRLEGVPLAIELAAARTTILSPASILQRFDQMLGVLEHHTSDAPTRHRSIHATLEWSYRLLSDQEQVLFRLLGVFAGGFSLEAVEAITGGEGEARDALEMLSMLSDKGLMIPELAPHDEPRYRMLETVRMYALEQLDRAGDRREVERRHAHYYLSLAERESARLRCSGPFVFSPATDASDRQDQTHPRWPAVLDREHANLQAALSWSRNHGDDAVLLGLPAALGRYWWVRGFLQVGTRWLREALDRNPDGPSALRSRALSGLGIIARQQGDFERASVLLEEAVALSRTLSEPTLLAAQLVDLGTVLGHLRRYAEAKAIFEESAEVSRARNDDWGTAAALSMLGAVHILLGQGDVAEQQLAQSVHLFQGLDDRRSFAIAGAMQARAIQMQGNGRRALLVLEDILPLCPAHTEDVMIAQVMECAACLVAGTGDPEACAQLLGVRERFRAWGYKRTPFEQVLYEEGLLTLEAQLGHEQLAAATEQGRHLSAEQAIAQALALVRAAMPVQPPAADTTMRTEQSPLSRREHQVLVLLAKGDTTKQLAGQLECSENTVKYHVKSILKKLGVHSRVEAASVAHAHGWLEQE